MRVLKFGGTSVGTADNMRKVSAIIDRQQATVVVLSAMSGTTDMLLGIAAAAQKSDTEKVEGLLAELKTKYTRCIESLFPDGNCEAETRLETVLGFIANETQACNVFSERNIVAQGELLTSALFALFLRSQKKKTVLLDATEFMCKEEDGRVDPEKIAERLAGRILDDGTRYITQGFICSDYQGRIDNLGRGGSDFSAALIGAALNAEQVQIWTDIDGMHNNDPRYVENTRPIRRLHFDEAAELAYFGAKILHPDTIRPCRDKQIPVLLKNTMEPEAEGTVVSNEENSGSVFHAVAAKDGITAIRIHSTGMLMAYGFLRRVFEVFEHYKTPIDMITTSEVAVSLTIDNTGHLQEIVNELQGFGNIETDSDNTIVCITGHLDPSASGLGARIADSLRDIPVKMISYGASERSIALLVDTIHKKETLNLLHKALLEVTC